MLQRLLAIVRIPELRRKFILTLILLAVYRMGYAVLLPMIDQQKLAESVANLQKGGSGFGQFAQAIALFSAADIGSGTIFGLGIMPYISTSILFQLLGTVYPPLERLQKEGSAGQRKINEYTRYATVLVCLFQSYFWVRMLADGRLLGPGIVREGYDGFWGQITATVIMTTGTIFLMWIGEQIDEYGIGNGISLLIMANILCRMPETGWQLLKPALENRSMALGTEGGIERYLLLAVLFVAVIISVVAITQGQRRIPIQSAKHVRGRRQMGGLRSYLPLRVNQAGVMPIIFASSLLMIPMFITTWLGDIFPNADWVQSLRAAFGDKAFVYNLLYIGLIYFFCYFWTAITFNPKDMSENLKDHGSFIPGYRPGTPTATHLEHVMVRITYVGAAFLAIVAVIPTVVAGSINVPYAVASFYGGTGLLIVVSVALDLVQKIDSHLVMRNQPGLLDSEY